MPSALRWRMLGTLRPLAAPMPMPSKAVVVRASGRVRRGSEGSLTHGEEWGLAESMMLESWGGYSALSLGLFLCQTRLIVPGALREVV